MIDPARRRILFALPALEGGGAERVVTHLLRGLPDADVPGFVTIHDLGGRRSRHAAPALIRLIWRLRPQIVLPTHLTLHILLLGLRAAAAVSRCPRAGP